MKKLKQALAFALCLLLLAQTFAFADEVQLTANDVQLTANNFLDGEAINLWARVDSDKLNYREQPKSSTDNVICKLTRQSTVFVYERDTDSRDIVWYKIKYYETEGWVQAEYIILMTRTESDLHALTDDLYGADVRGTSAPAVPPTAPTTPPTAPTTPPTAPTTPPTAPTTPPTGGFWGRTTSSSLNFREAPRTSAANVIRKLPKNTLVYVIEVSTVRDTLWYKISADTDVGYVMAEYVEMITPTTSPSTTPSEDPTNPPSEDPTNPPSEDPTNPPSEDPTNPPSEDPTNPPSEDPETTPPTGFWGVTNSKSLNFRSEPRTSSSNVIRRLPNNTLVYVIEERMVGTTLWYKVIVGADTGYVMAEFVKQTSPTTTPIITPSPTPSPTPFPEFWGKTIPASINMRVDPTGAVIRQLLKDTPVHVIGELMEGTTLWYEVTAGTDTGYVKAAFVKRDSPTATPSTSPTVPSVPPTDHTPTPPAGFWGITTSGNLNFREEPRTSSDNVIRKLTKDTLVYVIEERMVGTTLWYKVTVGTETGYIMASFIKRMNPTTAPSTSPSSSPSAPSDPFLGGFWGKTISASLNLRSDSSTSSSTIAKLPVNTFVYITDQVRNGDTLWYKVSTGGKTGYVIARYVQLVQPATSTPTTTPSGDPTPTPTATPDGRWGITNTDKLNMRSEPKTSASNVLVRLLYGTFVYITDSREVDGELWYYVRYEDKWGYVMAEFVDLVIVPTPVPTVTPTPSPTPTGPFIPDPSPTPSPDVSISTVIQYVMAQSTTSYSVVWNAATGASGYDVFLSLDDQAPELAISVTNTNATLNNLMAGRNYRVFVRPYVMESGTKKLGLFSDPYEFSALYLTISMESSTSNLIAWNTAPGASDYNVFRSTTRTGTYTYLGNVAALEYTDNDMTKGTVYFYKVQPCTRAASSVLIYSPYSPSGVGIALDTPVISAMSIVSDTSVQAVWSAVTGATGYILEYASVENGAFSPLTATTATFMNVSALETGERYLFRVRAYAAVAGETIYTPYSTVMSCTPVGAPELFSVTDTRGFGLSLSFSAVKGAAGYSIYRSTSADTGYTLLTEITASQAGAGDNLSYVDASALTNTTYYYKLCAYSTSNSVTHQGPLSNYESCIRTALVEVSYRALLVVEPTDLTIGDHTLKSTRATDLSGMENMIERLRMNDGAGNKVEYSSIIPLNGTTANTVFAKIAWLAEQADEDDVTLFYFMGHGATDGSICL